MEYIGKNQKTNDCAIVGIYNVSTWLKKDYSYEEIEYVAKEYYDYDPKIGLQSDSINDFMEFIEIPIKNLSGLELRKAEKIILSGNGALAYVKKIDSPDAHMFFIKPNKNRIDIINYDENWVNLVLKSSRKEIVLSMWSVGKAP